jgi:hypothetical protein
MSWLITGTQKVKGLLDEFSGAAAAYSLRDLTFLRGGPVVRVRRSSDNTEQDFTAAQVTDGTLTTFCGAGNGFVRTWYDQSGSGNHVAQTATGSQPQIIVSGVLNLLNTKPALKFNGSSSFLSGGNILNVGSNSFNTFVFSELANDNTLFAKALLGGLSGRYNLGTFSGNTSCLFTTTASDDRSATTANLYGKALYSSQVINGSSNKLFVNNVERASTAVPSYSNLSNSSRFLVGAYNNATDTGQVSYLNGSMCELIMYFSNQSGSRSAISSSINAHYSIY